jgi:hypothetical protein
LVVSNLYLLEFLSNGSLSPDQNEFDTTKDFDQLRKEIRAIELELANSDKGITTVQHQPISSDSKKIAPLYWVLLISFSGAFSDLSRVSNLLPMRSIFFKMSSIFLESDDIGWCCTGDKNSSNQDQPKPVDKKQGEGNLN